MISAFEASSVRSISTGSLNDISNFSLEIPRPLRRSNKQPVSTEFFEQDNFRHNSLLSSRSSISHRIDQPCILVDKFNDSDLRLEKIKKEMQILQQALQQVH